MKHPVFILGRLWRDVNGNTYHSCTIHYSDGTTRIVPFRYGYGSQYLQTAAEMLGVEYKDVKTIPHQAVHVRRKQDLKDIL